MKIAEIDWEFMRIYEICANKLWKMKKNWIFMKINEIWLPLDKSLKIDENYRQIEELVKINDNYSKIWNLTTIHRRFV